MRRGSSQGFAFTERVNQAAGRNCDWNGPGVGPGSGAPGGRRVHTGGRDAETDAGYAATVMPAST